MPLPVSYISDETAFNQIREALDYAETKGQDFAKACGIFCRWLLYSHKNDKDLSKADWKHIYKKTEALTSSRTYWSSLENPFFKLLDDLLINGDDALAAWKKIVYHSFAKELGKVFQLPANDRQAYKAIGVARNKAKVSILGESGMNEEKAVAERLVYYLENLVKRNDLGALADLRRGVGKLPGEVPLVIRHTAQFLPEGKETFFRAPVHLTATLFATHPKNTPYGNFGDHCVSLVKASGRKTSTDRQFLRLLTVSNDTLDIELRQFLGLLASQKISVNYKDLFRSIYNWDHPDKFIQQGWAESFYKEIDPNSKD
jgi:CRISPR type I-E-associated protein CasB/Cse2